MKTKQIFWGVFLVSVGILILLRNYIDYDFSCGDLWKLWPLVFVLVGINLMLKNAAAKMLLAGLTALLLAFALYASVNGMFGWFRDKAEFNIHNDDGDYEVSNYSAEFEKGIKNAALHVEAGAGSFLLEDTTNLLFDSEVEGKNNSYTLTSRVDNKDADLTFKMKSTKIFGKHKNRVEMRLNPVPVWDLYFDIGAAAVDFDFSSFNVKKLSIHMGAASLRLNLGSISSETRVEIDAGASSIDINIPEETGCEINADVSLSSKQFEGFSKKDEHIYRTDNFDTAKKKIFIDLSSGISTINVNRNNW